MRKKPLIDKDGEARELTAADLKKFKPLKEADPELYGLFKRSRGRPRVAKPKRQLTLRLPPDVIDRIKSRGRGYNVRIEKVLMEALERGKL